jgi:tetratricopeptide (TPR) repeat protein
MTRVLTALNLLAGGLACLLVSAELSTAREPGTEAPGIPGQKIVVLHAKLAEAGKDSSATAKRRGCKGVIREGEALVEAFPTDPNRYRVLGIVFRARQQLFGLENDDRNREALLETCRKLAEAPDEHAEMRLEADLLLSEAELSGRNATVEERARALEELLGRYRDTSAEVKSLRIAAGIAPKLEAFELATRIQRTMLERFGDDYEVIEFLRRSSNLGRMDVLFSGTFERVDGTTLSFPLDRSGHLSVIVFWSRATQGFEQALAKIGEHRQLYPGRIEFFSFNIDELPDGGEATLRALKLDWSVMRLPGGRNSQTFRTYGLTDPVGILVNAYGHVMLTSSATNYGRGQQAPENPHRIDDARISDERYLTQLQSLFIGDFLVDDPGTPGADGEKPPGSVPAEELRAIQGCFVPAPLRYRLTRGEALANYEKAAQLCDEVITRHPDAPDLWRVRERRIIALLGRWNLAAEPKFLEQAAQEARAALAKSPPPGAGVVPRFCLAKEALRRDRSGAGSVLSGMIDALGGSEAPGTALAAAAILALDANSRELHERYRTTLLDRHAEVPALWPVLAFLRDRYHTLHLLRANFIRHEEGNAPSREHLVNHGLEPMTRTLPKIELKTLDGATLHLPQDTADKLTLLMFVEPPADPAADFPVALDSQGRPTKGDPIRQVMDYALERAELHIHKEVKVIAAFLCDDAERVRGLMTKNGWPCQAAMVPDGLHNPLVRQLGILSADRIPNVFLLRRDGTIAWHTSGFLCKSDYGYPFAIWLAMKLHIEVCDAEFACRALAEGDFEKAKRVFSGPFLPERDERYLWQGPRSYGRALANIGLKDWAAALVDIDATIQLHERVFRRRPDSPCESMLAMQRARALILEKLGRQDEAKAAQEAAAVPPAPCYDTPYERFHRKLGQLPIVPK